MRVSCLMVTSYEPQRRASFEHSLESYARQTYSDRELIVVSHGMPQDRDALATALQRGGRTDVRLVAGPEGACAGELRNLALDSSTGEVVCQWDDDHLFHPQRIARQLASLADEREVASILAAQWSLHQRDGRLVVIDWRSALMKGHPATLLVRRELGLRYPVQTMSERREDASMFYEVMRRRLAIAAVEDAPELFVSRFYAAQPADERHYERWVTRYGRSREELLADEERLTCGLEEILLEQDEAVVDGSDGPAFSVKLRRPRTRAQRPVARRAAGAAPARGGSALPKVSCLMVTSFAPARREFLARSLACYAAQTYPNRELVVVGDCLAADQERLVATIAALGRDDTRVFFPPKKLTLGALRNFSLAHATGEFTCQWDDDDLFHPQRVERQVAPLLAGGAQASLLGKHFYYFQPQQRMFVVDWRTTLVGGHHGTLTMRRTLGVSYTETNPAGLPSEDSALFHQLRRRRVPIAILNDAPELFVYRFHGVNAWARGHHDRVVAEHGCPRTWLVAEQERLSRGLREVFRERPAVTVEGREGEAFEVALGVETAAQSVA